MNEKKPSFDELVGMARRGLNDHDLSAPPGFAHRVAARWANGTYQTGWLGFFERAVSWGAASALAMCLVVAWYCHADFNPSSRAADSFASFAGLDDDDRF